MKTASHCAPILLLGFNRADLMSAQINAIRHARPAKIYLAVDGPRPDKPNEAEQCQAVRNCVNDIDWPCETKTLFREKNLGCKYGVSGAITWFFEHEEMGIVLEDDCRPTPDFLRFASEMLERYKDDERIGAVNGFNCFNLQSDKSASYHFSRHMDIWGWASWRRAWKEYDVEMASFKDRLPEVIKHADITPYYKKVLRGFIAGLDNGLSTWDVQFAMLSLRKGWLNIVPRRRLVANVGITDNRATHTGGWIYWGDEWSKAEALDFPLVHPQKIACDKSADYIRERMDGALFPRGLTWLGAKFPSLCGILKSIGGTIRTIAPFLFK